MFYVFFFFKQKTAYEMRISDWSSDVCSSDLPETIEWARQMGAHHVIDHNLPLGEQLKALGIPQVRYVASLSATSKHLPVFPEIKIGRASCRERVCQYV